MIITILSSFVIYVLLLAGVRRAVDAAEYAIPYEHEPYVE